MSKKLKFTHSAEASDRKAMRLADSWERKELSDEEYLDSLEELCRESPRGVMLESLYANMYISQRSYDRHILLFLNAALKKHPDHPLLATVMIQAADEFGLDAFFLHYSMIALECATQTNRMVSRSAGLSEDAEKIQILADYVEEAATIIRADGFAWDDNEIALVAMDQAVWESMLGLDDEANRTAERVLVDHPRWLPALMTRAKVAWDTCRFEKARETWQSAAGIGESAAHRTKEALSLILESRENEAAPIVDALLGLPSMEPDSAALAELFIAAGRGTDAHRVFGSFIKSKAREDDTAEYFVHLAAGIAMIAGDEARAAKLWRRVKEDPFERSAKENLLEIKRPPENRTGPFLFRLIDLVPTACRSAMDRYIIEEGWEYELAVDMVLGVLRTRAPGLVKGLGRILIRYGDLSSIHIFIRRLACPWFPELDSWLLNETRMADISPARRELIETELAEAGLFASEGRTPEKPDLSRWTITWEPHKTSSRTRHLHDLGFDCLDKEDWKGALTSFRSLTELEPDDPVGWNNLRFSLDKLGRKDEVARLGLEMRSRFPAYIQTQVGQAREFAAAGDPARALRILDGLLARDFFHGKDLRAVLQAQIDIRMTSGDSVGAVRHFDVWEGFERDPEMLKSYLLLKMASGLQRMQDQFEKRAQRKQARLLEKADREAAHNASSPGSTESAAATASGILAANAQPDPEAKTRSMDKSGKKNDKDTPNGGKPVQPELF